MSIREVIKKVEELPIEQLTKELKEAGVKFIERDVQYYMKLPYKVETLHPIGLNPNRTGVPYYMVGIRELPGCMTEGETKEEALENMERVKRLWFEAAIEDGCKIPLPEGTTI